MRQEWDEVQKDEIKTKWENVSGYIGQGDEEVTRIT